MISTPAAVPALLVLGWGNPSRGDDALGPWLLDQLAAWASDQGRTDIECLCDFQLQVEHALDLVGRQRVLFVDASVIAAPPFELTALHPARDRSAASHALSPPALLQVYQQLHERPPPPSWQLAVRGERFELGAPASAAALHHGQAALRAAQRWLQAPADWR